MGPLKNLGYQLLLIVVIPGLIPICLIRYKAYLDAREVQGFSSRMNEWHENCSKRRRRFIRGVKARTIYHNCAAAILMTIPFSIITSTHQIVLKLWGAASICAAVALFASLMYFILRDVLVDIDFNVYRYNMSVGLGLRLIIWGTTVFLWIVSAGIFYVIIMDKV